MEAVAVNNRPRPLVGTDEVSVDDKGRVLLSKKHQERMGKNFAVLISAVGCICLYPEDEWFELYDKISSASVGNLWREQYSRLVLGDVEDDQNLDSNGRYLIPARQRSLGHVEQKGRVVIKGMGKWLEIWDAKEYEFFTRDPESYNRQRREMFERAYSKAFPTAQAPILLNFGGEGGGNAG